MDGNPQVPTEEDAPAAKVKQRQRTQSKSVFFADEIRTKDGDTVVKVNKNPHKGKRDFKLLTSGNCTDNYSAEEIKNIEENTALLYNHNVGPSRTSTDRNTSQSFVDGIIASSYLELPEAIAKVLNDELGFLNKSTFVHHSHLQESKSFNPFQTKQNSIENTVQNKAIKETSGQYSSTLLNLPATNKLKLPTECSELCVCCGLIKSFAEFNVIKFWTKQVLYSHISYTSQVLSRVQSRCLSSFVVFAFEFSRQLQITPRRLAYAR